MNFDLENVNPLENLDEWKLVDLLNRGQRGDFSRLQWLYFFVEKRNPYARAVKHRILSAIGKLDWDIKMVEGSAPDSGAVAGDSPATSPAEAQAATLRAAYDRIGNLQDALKFLALGELRGFSHLEKIFDADLNVVELRPVEQWFWVKNGWYGKWAYNGEARESAEKNGTPITFANFIIREIDDAIDEIMARCHVRMETADGDWEEYLRDYGLPNIIVEGPPNVPPEKEAQYQTQAERITGGARGYIPNGAKVHSMESKGGDDAFKLRIDFLSELIAIAGTGGKLNILTESGTGTMGAGAVKDAFDDLAESIAGHISGVLQSQFDRQIIEAAHPGEPILAYFELAGADDEDTSAVLTDAKTAFDAGYEIDAADLSERTGYKLVRSGGVPTAVPNKEAVTPPTPPAAVTPPLRGPAFPEAVAAELKVTPEFLAPAKTVLDELTAKAGTVSDADFFQAAQDLLDNLPKLALQSDVTSVALALQNALESGVNAYVND